MVYLRLVRLGVGVQRTGTLGRRQKSTYIEPSSSMSDNYINYNNELKEQLGANTIEYFKASSVLGKLTLHAYAETKAANAETKAAVAKILEAYVETKAAVAETNAAVAEVTEARFKVFELSRDLVDANTENLRLKGMLDVRGMLEEVERLISPDMLRDPDVNRTALWHTALHSPRNKALADVLIACFPTQIDSNSAKAAAVSTIKRVYKKASNKIHSHIAIVVHLGSFTDNELHVIRALAKFYKFKIVEVK